MFIFYFAKNFLYNIFERNYACSPSKFIHHYCNTFLLLHKKFHKLLSSHIFGHNGNRINMLFPLLLMFEHF